MESFPEILFLEKFNNLFIPKGLICALSELRIKMGYPTRQHPH